MEKTRAYEGLFIITPDREESIEESKNSINAIISDNSGEIVKENMMGKKKLAYPIKKKKEGIYYEVTFDALPSSIANMTRLFRINTDILRALIDKAQ